MLASGAYAAFPSTPQHASTMIEVAGSLAILRKGQETRVFERSSGRSGSGNNYRLTHLGSSTGHFIALSYRRGSIRSISDADGPVFEMTRDHAGRIVSVQDRWGREVQYRYGADGRLSEAVDIAGNSWAYEYAAHGQLTRAMGPNERDILRITYDDNARVRESLSGRRYVFTYDTDATIVVEGTGHVHGFEHNAAGITDRFDSTNGVWWQLRFDNRNRVVAAFLPNGAYQYSYNSDGGIARVTKQLPDDLSVKQFEYDNQGRITGVYSDTGALTAVDYAGSTTRISGPEGEFSFDALPAGTIGEVRTHNLSISAEYDSANHLAAFRSTGTTVQFGRDDMGRVSVVRYADGKANEYEYDDLGNRKSVRFGLGGAVQYQHDPSGNIVEVAVTNPNGEQLRQVVEIGDMNRVESIHYEKAGKLEISYDRMGRAVQFKMGVETVSVEYEGPSRISRIRSMLRGTDWSPDDSRKHDQETRQLTDARNELFHRDSAGYPHPDYGFVQFDEFSIAMFASDPLELEVAGLRQARDLLATAEPLLVNENLADMIDFEKPSNSVFQPLEYRSTNCCIQIPVNLRAVIVPCTNQPSDESTQMCYCLPILIPQPSLKVSQDTGHVWPRDENRPIANSQAVFSISSSNIAEGTPVRTQLRLRYDGGHSNHRGTRPLGTLQPASGQINAQGGFQTQFTASHFGGDINIVVTVGDLSSTRTIQVRVPYLVLVSEGEGYFMVGSTGYHPTGWYATYSARSDLKSIARAYKEFYYSEEDPQPAGKRLAYNDMSLFFGGKFELRGNWCIPNTQSCHHHNHRYGRNADISDHNVLTTRWAQMEIIFRQYDAGVSHEIEENHWHLTF